MTNRQLISNILNRLRAKNIDDWVSPKFILYTAIDVVGDFLKKQSDKARIIRETEGWSSVDCLTMREVAITECDVDINLCEKMMKSVEKLPDTYTGVFGDIIKYVANQNFSKFYERITPREWNSIQKRQFIGENRYYFVINGYLYIPIPKKTPFASPESVRIEAYFKKKWEVEKLNNTTSCQDCSKDNTCIKPLDFDFVCPMDLLSVVQTETFNLIVQSLKIPTDDLNNLNQNQKSENG